MTADNMYKYLEKMPHIWCAGCGNGIVVGAMLRAIETLQVDQEQIAVVSGIGCSGRAGNYLNLCGFQPTHGRALAYATGVKLGNPRLHVIVLAGDGDTLSIGGNHFIHACRRNIDLTLVLFNNSTYGMTGGQHAPTTPIGARTSTTPYGNMESSFNALDLAQVSGATYLARGSICQPRELSRLIARGMGHRGFAVIEALTICPTLFGRMNKLGSAVEMMQSLRESTTPRGKTSKSPEQEGKMVTGELYVREGAQEFTELMAAITEKAQAGGK
jgi:2-oxoglutarate/2-oxoacid ferredoxin oxidoreductase subunit beta